MVECTRDQQPERRDRPSSSKCIRSRAQISLQRRLIKTRMKDSDSSCKARAKGCHAHPHSCEVAQSGQHSDIDGEPLKSECACSLLVAGSSCISPKSFSKLICFASEGQLQLRMKGCSSFRLACTDIVRTVLLFGLGAGALARSKGRASRTLIQHRSDDRHK